MLENIDKVKEYVFDFLKHGTPPHLKYHNLRHTEQVYEAGIKIAKLENISKNDMRLLETAILFHDLGNIVQRQGHETISTKMANNILPAFGYNNSEIEQVSGIILATEYPQKPQSHLGEIMADADLSLMGYNSWGKEIDGYRIELGQEDLKQWYKGQKGFLTNHNWFTNAAKTLFDKQKKENIIYCEKQIMKL